MIRMFYVIMLCAYGLATTSLAGQRANYTTLVMPENVMLGMSLEAFQPVRRVAKKLELAVGSRNTNAMVLTEIKTNGAPFVCYQYHFIEDRLRAVTQGILHAGKRDEQMIAHIHDALTKDLFKKSDMSILRLDEHMQPILLNAELWTDAQNGVCVCFVDASNEMTVITFDPKYFGKKDFFMSPDEMPKIAPALETVRKTIEDSKKLKK